MFKIYKALDTYAKVAIAFLVTSWFYFWIVSCLNYLDFAKQLAEWPVGLSFPLVGFDLKYSSSIYQFICIGLGIASLFFSLSSKKETRYKKRFIFLSLAFIVISYFFFSSIIFDIYSLYYDLTRFMH